MIQSPVFILLFFLLSSHVQAQIRPHALFCDHAVLQRNVPVPIWGTAKPGEKITITGASTPLGTQTDRQGKWVIPMPAQPASGPFSLTISGSQSAPVFLRDLVYGDVWLCSGQSNMDMKVQGSDGYNAEKLRPADPMLRHVRIPTNFGPLPLDTLPPLEWTPAGSATVGDFSGVSYYFGKSMRQAQKDVAVGLLNSSWGGTRLECWSSLAAMGYQSLADASAYHQQEADRRRREVAKFHPNIPETDIGLAGGKATFAALDFDDKNWKKAEIPSWLWGEGKESFDGVFWFRKSIEVPATLVGRPVTLSLGYASDALMVWVNGWPVDTLSRVMSIARSYTLPPGVLRPGRNVVTLRVLDEGAATGIWEGTGVDGKLELTTPTAQISLAGEWAYTLTKFQYVPEKQSDTAPTLIYNAMISPLLRFPIRGVLWYQGESNSWPMPGIYNYRTQLAAMATDWRRSWGQGDMPFLIVQLTSFGDLTTDANKSSNWALLRESQAVAANKLPNAALITTLDVGDPKDVHPTNKRTVGERLALAGRALAYGEKTVYRAPTTQSMRLEGQTVYLTFANTGGGLQTTDKYGYVSGFTVAGADGHFHWATARISGDTVLVSCQAVPNPVAVRYAWANSPIEANLVGGTGLPVGTFRTDTWPLKF